MTAVRREALARRRAALSPAARAALAKRLRGGQDASGDPIPRRGGSGDAPLSLTQEQFWLRQQAFPEDAATNVFVPVRLRGHLDVVALEHSCADLVGRYEILRSRFVEVDGEPRQRVAGPDELAIRHADLSSSGTRALAELARAEAGRTFDLAADPPIRVVLARLAEGDHALLLTIHHIATDAWSNAVLLGELATIYRARLAGERPRLGPPALPFADYARWQREQLGEETRVRVEAYWRGLLAEAPRGLELPIDRPRRAAGPRRSGRLITSVPAGSLAALVELCRSIRVPTFAGLMAVLQTVLHRYGRATDFLVGVPFSGRQRPELTRVVGPLFTTVPLRANVFGNPSFVELVTRVRAAAAEAFNHGALAPTMPFEVLFALQDAPRPAVELPEVTVEQLELGEGTAQCPLTLSAASENNGGLRLIIDYDRDLFDRATIERFAGHYRQLVDSLVATPEAPVAAVSMLTAAERTALAGWIATEVPRPPNPVVHELFARQVRRTPDAPALRRGEVSLSYAELERRALERAARLAGLGVRRGDVVGVCLDRSAELVVTVLAVLFAGAAYLPLDPAHPAARRERAVAHAGARLVIDGELPEAEPMPGWRPPTVDSRDPAYVIFTSGSTGEPKGVLVAHDGVCNNALWRREITGLGPGDRLLHTVSFAFDPSVWQLFGPLLAGAEVILAEDADPERFVDLVQRHRVTIADFVPSLLAQVLDVARPGRLDSLRHVFCGGERLPRDLANRCGRTLHAALHNQYGPTEATIDTTSHPVAPGEDGEVPIGRPIANKRVYVLDGRHDSVPVGVAGELWIGGTGLAYGYVCAAAETAARFRPDPFGPPGSRMYRSGDLVRWRNDGGLEFLGRIDDQVKVNGVRIEPAEIADALRRHPDVSDAVVVPREVAGRAALVAYVVARDGVDVAGPALRAHVADRLPPAFVPAHVVAVEAIPLGVTGKVAVDRLPEVRREVAPRRSVQPGSTEEALLGVWHAVTGQDDTGVDDDFFALGGDSLLAVRLIAAVREKFAVELPLPEFFAAPTVAGLAALVDTRRAAGWQSTAAPALVRHRSDTAPLSFAQERVYRQAMAGAGPDELHLNVLATLRGELDPTALAAALHMVITRHEALRVAIEPDRQIVREPYEIRLDEPAGLSLVDGRLLDAALRDSGPGEHELSLTLHRIAADGVSSQVLARDLALAYAALRTGRRPELPALTVQHPDYARWERAALTADTVDRAVRDWLGTAGDLSWLRAGSRSVGKRRARHVIRLDPAQIHSLSTVARKHRCSLRTILLSLWTTACADRLEIENLVACVPVSGRDHPALRDVVGRLVNMAVLPIRRELANRPDLVAAAANRAYERARLVPFLALENAIDPGHDGFSPVFPLLFDVADRPDELPAIAGLDIAVRPPREPWTDFGLAMQAHYGVDGLELIVLHDPEIYSEELVGGLFDDIREAVR